MNTSLFDRKAAVGGNVVVLVFAVAICAFGALGIARRLGGPRPSFDRFLGVYLGVATLTFLVLYLTGNFGPVSLS
jgi:hypothetical protein